ncbi:MAG TPA: hypothetical protein PK431_01715 [Chitinophagales bacterium]|nr:hypothetical protein [Chitinophagales bacterium]
MKDFILNTTTLDIEIKDGDFVIGDSTVQNQHLLLLANKGDFKEHPKVGVGMNSYLLDEAEQELMRAIRDQFEADGMKVKSLIFNDGKVTIDANYNG